MRGPRHVIGAAIVIVAIGLGISGAATAADVTVTLTTSGPQPARLSVALGDTVTFVNSTPDARTLTSDDQSFTAATIPAGATYKWVAVDPGNISYRFGDGRTDRGARRCRAPSSSGPSVGTRHVESIRRMPVKRPLIRLFDR